MTDTDILVRISRLYYELGETQERIASSMSITRSQVSRLLKEARAAGVVDIRVNDGLATSPAAAELKSRFNLQDVALAPSVTGPEDHARRAVGRLAAQVLRVHVRDGATIGVGEGAHVGALADALPELDTRIACTFVPIAGGSWFGGGRDEPFRRIARTMGASALGLYAPAVVPDPATRDALFSHPAVQGIRALWSRLDVAVFGIGGQTRNYQVLGSELAPALDAAGAVGEIAISPFDINGRFLDTPLSRQLVAIEPAQLRSLRLTIGLAAGQSKVRPVLGALRSGVVRILVSDVATAEAVLAEDRRSPQTS